MKAPDRMLVIWAGLILVLSMAECWAAQPYEPVHPDPVLEPWRWRTFPDLNGLGIRCMVEDRNGQMWFGTQEGVRSYNGITWTDHTPDLPGTPVETLLAARDGSVYAGMKTGISRFKEGAWNRVFPSPGDSLAWQVWDLLEASDGILWAGTNRGALRLGPDGTTFYTTRAQAERLKVQLPNVGRSVVPYETFSVFDVYQTRDNAIWFGLQNGEIVRYDPDDPSNAWQRHTRAEGLDVGRWPRMVQTRDGALWVATRQGNRGLNRFDGKTWTTTRLSRLGGSDINPSILETRDGTLWVGGYNRRLHAYRNGAWTVYDRPDIPIPTVRIQALLETSDGSLWIAGRYKEVVRLEYHNARWRTYQDLVFQCETPDGARWFVSGDSSVVVAHGNAWTRYGVEDGLMEDPRRLLVTRDGALWAAGSHRNTAATAQFDGDGWAYRTHPRLSRRIQERAVYEASDGALWFGAGGGRMQGQAGGLLRFQAGAWTHYHAQGVPRSVSGIGQTADGTLWFGGNSLVRFDGQDWQPLTEPEGLAPGNRSDVVSSTAEGALWIGTRAYGVFHFDGKAWTRHDTRDGLADNRIRAILHLPGGALLVGTDRGISYFDGQTWTTLDLHPNPVAPDLAMGGLRWSGSGALWITFSSPRTQLTRRFKPDADPPETQITFSPAEVAPPGNVTLTWQGADRWAATPDARLQFAWRLDGGPWSPFADAKSHRFQALPPGAYTFEVRARDGSFNSDSTPAVARFTVLPPTWQQPWFLSLMAVVGIVIGYLASRILVRDRMLRASNEALSTANRDLFSLNQALRQQAAKLETANQKIQQAARWKTQFLEGISHELRTPLNAILGFTSLVTRRSGEALPKQQRENLAKVKQGGEYLLSLVDDILDLTRIEGRGIEIHAERIHISTLVLACRETVEPLLKPGVVLVADVSDNVGEAHTDKARLRQVLINLLGHAAKVTEAGEVKIRVAGEGPSELVLAVSNTGPSIPTEALETIFDEFHSLTGSGMQHEDTGFGLSISKRLVELLGGTIRVESQVGKGSTFTVQIPMVYRES